MSSTFTTVTFYVAPSKERHPLVSELLRAVGRDGKSRIVHKVTRTDSFLTGSFEICDGDMYDEDEEDYRQMYGREQHKEWRIFCDLYRQLCNLGYISEDHRCSWWSSNGAFGSDWEMASLAEHESREFLQKEKRRKLKLFWQEYPNLMSLIKYGYPADDHRRA